MVKNKKQIKADLITKALIRLLFRASVKEEIKNRLAREDLGDMKKQIRFIPITNMWYEDNDLFIRVKERAGLYYLEISETQRLNFLADSYHKDNENGRVYKFVGIAGLSQQEKKAY